MKFKNQHRNVNDTVKSNVKIVVFFYLTNSSKEVFTSYEISFPNAHFIMDIIKVTYFDLK